MADDNEKSFEEEDGELKQQKGPQLPKHLQSPLGSESVAASSVRRMSCADFKAVLASI